tara:strand:+ start:2909 stop:4741 length:1833 start_codon:yes stop_codon:yes gene_type:complete
MKLIHSHHYFDKNINVELDNNILKNKENKTTILELVNLPINTLYKVKVEKLLVKKKSLINYIKLFGFREIEHNTKYNTKVIIDVDINSIIKYLKMGKTIPYRDELFNIIRNNNIRKDIDDLKMLHTLDISFNNSIIFNKNIYYIDNIVKYGNLYFDTKINRIYLKYEDIKQKYIDFDGALLFYQNFHFLNNKLINLLCKNTLIVYDNINTFIPLLDKCGLKYIIIEKNKYDTYTYGDVIDKIILVNYDFFNSNKYEINCFNNIQAHIDTIKYELSLVSSTIFKNKKKIILQALDYDLVLFEEKNIKNDNIIKNIKSINYKKKVIISNNFLKYNIHNLKIILDTYFNVEVKINENIIKAITNNILIEKWNKVIYKKIYLKLTKYENQIYEKIKSQHVSDLFLSTSLNITKLMFKQINKEDNIVLTNDVCPICIEKLNINNLCKTSCNHYYCYDCIYKSIETNNKCPKCRTSIENIIIIKNDITSSNTNTNKPNMGIKMISILENIKNNQLIISKYSQSSSIISDILNNFNINNTLFVKKNNKLEKIENKHNNKINNLFVCDYDSFDILDLVYLDIVNSAIFLEKISDKYIYIPEKISKFNITDIKSLNIIS